MPFKRLNWNIFKRKQSAVNHSDALHQHKTSQSNKAPLISDKQAMVSSNLAYAQPSNDKKENASTSSISNTDMRHSLSSRIWNILHFFRINNLQSGSSHTSKLNDWWSIRKTPNKQMVLLAKKKLAAAGIEAKELHITNRLVMAAQLLEQQPQWQTAIPKAQIKAIVTDGQSLIHQQLGKWEELTQTIHSLFAVVTLSFQKTLDAQGDLHAFEEPPYLKEKKLQVQAIVNKVNNLFNHYQKHAQLAAEQHGEHTTQFWDGFLSGKYNLETHTIQKNYQHTTQTLKQLFTPQRKQQLKLPNHLLLLSKPEIAPILEKELWAHWILEQQIGLHSTDWRGRLRIGQRKEAGDVINNRLVGLGFCQHHHLYPNDQVKQLNFIATQLLREPSLIHKINKKLDQILLFENIKP